MLDLCTKRKKKSLLERLYKTHLDCAKTWRSVWQHTQSYIKRNVDEQHMLSRYCTTHQNNSQSQPTVHILLIRGLEL